MNGGHGALVEPARRLRRNQDLRPVMQVAAEDELLHVAARQQSRACRRPAAANIELTDDLLGEGHAGPTVDQPETRKARRGDALQYGIFPDSEFADRAFLVAILRYAADAGSNQASDADLGNRLSEQKDVATAPAGKSADEMAKGRLAVAGDADNAERFAGWSRKLNPSAAPGRRRKQ